MPIYRVRYRPKSDGADGPWTTLVDAAQTAPSGDIDTGSLLGGSVTVTGLTNNSDYEFVVDRMDGTGGVARSSTIAEETPQAPIERTVDAGTGSLLSAQGQNPNQSVVAQLVDRDGTAGAYITFGNASWTTASFFFRPRGAGTFPGDPGSPNLAVTRRPYSVVAAVVDGSGIPPTQCLKVSNTKLFVPFDYETYDLRVKATYAAANLEITILSP